MHSGFREGGTKSNFVFANFLGSWDVDSKNGKKIFLKILPKNFWEKICEKISGKKIPIFFLHFWNLHLMIRENLRKKNYFSSPLSETTVHCLFDGSSAAATTTEYDCALVLAADLACCHEDHLHTIVVTARDPCCPFVWTFPNYLVVASLRQC